MTPEPCSGAPVADARIEAGVLAAPHFLARRSEGELDLGQKLLCPRWTQLDNDLFKLALHLLSRARNRSLALLGHERARRFVRCGADVVHIRFGDNHPLLFGAVDNFTCRHGPWKVTDECSFVSLTDDGFVLSSLLCSHR